MKLSKLGLIAFALFVYLCHGNPAWGFELYDPDDTGLGEKFVVTGENCVLYAELGSQSTEVPPLTLLWRLDVPGSDDGLKKGKDGKTYCHVGNADGEEWGWIEWKKEWDTEAKPDECPVTKWNTRFLHKPLRPTPERYYEIFEDSDASKRLATYTGKSVDTEIYAFITQKPGDKSNDTDTEIYSTKPVFFYVGQPKTTGKRNRPVQRVNDRVDVSSMKMEVVFVIDTTRSMEPLIGLAQKTCQKLVDEIQAHPEYKDLVRFGLVEFRDDTIVKGNGDDEHIEKITIGGNYFISRVVQPLSDNHQEFISKLSQLSTCKEPNGDEPEQVGCGLMTALTEIHWSNNSTKHIILLGDNPNKQKSLNPDSNGLLTREDFSVKNACSVPGISDLTKVSLTDIVTYARKMKDNEANNIVNFHALMYDNTSALLEQFSKDLADTGFRDIDDLIEKIINTDELNESEKKEMLAVALMIKDSKEYVEETERQFGKLAQNGEQYQGVFKRIEGDSGISTAVAELLQILYRGIKSVKEARISAETGEAMEKVTEEDDGAFAVAVWEFAQANQKPGSANNKAMYGYARAKDSNGNLIAEPTVLILYEDMESLHTNLVSFKKRLEKYLHGKGNLKMIFEDFRKEFGETAAGNEIDDKTSIEDLIATEFPVKTDVLSTTLEQLRGMSDDEFKEWVDKLDAAIKTAEITLEKDNAWIQSQWTPPKGKPQKYQYMPVSELP